MSKVVLSHWLADHRAVERDAVKRLKDLKKENARVKRLVANHQLDFQILRKIAKGEF